MTAYAQTDKLGFETKPCSRCGGSGRYSWCQMWGDTCFKCSGKGITYTARGSEAIKFFRESRKVLYTDLKIGDRCYWEDGIFHKSAWTNITEIQRGDDGLTVTANEYQSIHLSSSCMHLTITRDDGPDLYAERLAAALAYQDTLTKTGKPRKR